MEEGICICKDEKYTVTRTCFNCSSSWDTTIDDHERLSRCPIHHRQIAICGLRAYLCQKCVDDKYTLKFENGFGFPNLYQNDVRVRTDWFSCMGRKIVGYFKGG